MYKRVLAVCEDPSRLDGFRDLLCTSRNFDFIEASSLAEAMARLETRMDVALLLLSGSRAERIRFIKSLRARSSSMPILLCCDPGEELAEADECLPTSMQGPAVIQRIVAHALLHEEREMLLESNSFLKAETDKLRKIHFVTLEYANMIENDLMDRIKDLLRAGAGARTGAPEGGAASELELLRAENGRLRLEVEKLDVILATVISHDTLLEDQLNSRIRETSDLAFHDPLTGIFNRRKFNEELIKEYSASEAGRRPLSLIMFDIDNFKKVNDDFGHLVGDEILKVIAQTVGERLPKGSVFARWGGEEFMVITPCMELAAAACAAEKLRCAIRDTRTSGQVGVTCSFGVIQVEENEEPQSLLARLDSNLYVAKQEGRNCVRAGTRRRQRRRKND